MNPYDVNLLIKKIQSLTTNLQLRRVITNVFSLSSIQILNYIVPLVTLPHFLRVLGIEQYGLFTFSQVVISYFESLLQYSFTLTAVNKISKNIENKKNISMQVSVVILTKIILTLIAFLLITLMIFFLHQLNEIKHFLYFSIIFFIANILNFDYFFQGIQEMKNIAILNFIGKIVNLIWIFSMVKVKNDIFFAFLSTPLTAIFIGFISIYILQKKYKIVVVIPKFNAVIKELRLGFQIFLSQFLVRFYSADINITALGFMSNKESLGAYILSNRIFSLFASVTGPITNSLYPYLSNLYYKSKSEYFKKITQIIKYIFFFYGSLSFFVYTFSEKIIFLITGTLNSTASDILKVLSLALVFSPFGAILNQLFILNNKAHILTYLSITYIIINLLSLYTFYHYYQAIGLAIVSVIVHIAIFILPIFFFVQIKNANENS